VPPHWKPEPLQPLGSFNMVIGEGESKQRAWFQPIINPKEKDGNRERCSVVGSWVWDSMGGPRTRAIHMIHITYIWFIWFTWLMWLIICDSMSLWRDIDRWSMINDNHFPDAGFHNAGFVDVIPLCLFASQGNHHSINFYWTIGFDFFLDLRSQNVHELNYIFGLCWLFTGSLGSLSLCAMMVTVLGTEGMSGMSIQNPKCIPG
jgi:hypothetical protein